MRSVKSDRLLAIAVEDIRRDLLLRLSPGELEDLRASIGAAARLTYFRILACEHSLERARARRDLESIARLSSHLEQWKAHMAGHQRAAAALERVVRVL
jgi:hypothetical protein